MDKIFYINMLGGCSITCGDKKIDSNSLRSKKIWELLAYLIVYRNKDISQSELIDLVYSEEKSNNPANALKTLMHRVRAALDELGVVSGKEIITQQNGSYKWNREFSIVLDTERFEELSQKAQSSALSDDQRLDKALEAIALFKGDFLPRFSTEPWVMPLHTYYHSTYMRLVHDAIELLAERGRNIEISEICQKAIAIDPYDEYLYLQLMQVMVNMEQYQNAMDQYEKTTKLFYREFGVTPSDEMKALYRQIAYTNQGVELDLNVVKERLRETDETIGAFFCEYEFFKSVYQLEVRSAARSGEPIHICLMTVSPKDSTEPLTNKQLNLIIDKLMDCVKATLRRGDVFARFSISQLIIMLPMTTMENSEMVLSRIVKRYRAAYPRSHGEVSYCFQSIEAMF